MGFTGITDSNGDGKIDAREFRAARDKSGAITAISPRFNEYFSLICADPELKAMVEDIERDTLRYSRSNTPYTKEDFRRQTDKTAAFYEKLVERARNGDLAGANGGVLSPDVTQDMIQKFGGYAAELRGIQSTLNQGAIPSEYVAQAGLIQALREELKRFSSVEYAPMNDCTISHNNVPPKPPGEKDVGRA